MEDHIMSKQKETTILEKITGADLNKWRSRLSDYIQQPERRSFMLQKLKSVIKRKLEGQSNPLKDIDTFKNIKELLLHQLTEITEQYEIYKYNGPYTKNDPRISIIILKTDTQVNEVQSSSLRATVDNSVLSRLVSNKVSFESKDFNLKLPGNIASYLLKMQNPEQNHLIVSGTFSRKNNDGTEAPFYGRIAKGKTKMPIIDKGDQHLNEFTSGGIVIYKGKLEIRTYSELLQRANQKQYDLIEQTIFIADSYSNSRQLLEQSEAFNNRIDYMLFIGYFIQGSKKQYFSVHATCEYPVEMLFEVLESQKKHHDFDGWAVACVELGGGFSGFVTNDAKGDVKEKGPSTDEDINSFCDTGHWRQRFFCFSFEDPLQK